MIQSLTLPPSSSSPSTIPFEVRGVQNSRFSSTICCSSRSNAYIPKLEPFSRSKFDRIIKDPPLIQKCENELADYCSTLEGDNSYSCWRAYFELKDLEREMPKKDVERLILGSGGVKSLIGCLHGIAAIYKGKKQGTEFASSKIEEARGESSCPRSKNEEARGESSCPIPDGLPKSQEELEEDERGRMPDSQFTRMLRNKGRFPAWYSPAPDHETD